MRRITAILGLCLVVTGCARVELGKDSVLLTNASVKKNNINLGTMHPVKDADLKAAHNNEAGVLGASFGNIAYDYISSSRDVPLVVFCGGNGFRLNYGGAFLAPGLFESGDVFMFDYPGLGESAGDGSRAQFKETLDLVSKKIAEISAARTNHKVIYYGHSFGGGVCAGLAHQNPAAAVVLAATFADFHDAAEVLAPIQSKLAKITIADDTPEYKIPPMLAGFNNPVFVIASQKDETIKLSASQKLYDKLKAQGNKAEFIVVANAAHNKVPTDAETIAKLRTALNNAGVE